MKVLGISMLHVLRCFNRTWLLKLINNKHLTNIPVSKFLHLIFWENVDISGSNFLKYNVPTNVTAFEYLHYLYTFFARIFFDFCLLDITIKRI